MIPQIKGIALAERDKDVLNCLQRAESTRNMSAEEYARTTIRFYPSHPFWKHMERVAKSIWPANNFSLITLRLLWESDDGEATYEIYVCYTDHSRYAASETRISDDEIMKMWGPL